MLLSLEIPYGRLSLGDDSVSPLVIKASLFGLPLSPLGGCSDGSLSGLVLGLDPGHLVRNPSLLGLALRLGFQSLPLLLLGFELSLLLGFLQPCLLLPGGYQSEFIGASGQLISLLVRVLLLLLRGRGRQSLRLGFALLPRQLLNGGSRREA